MPSMILVEILNADLQDIHKLKIPVIYYNDGFQRLKQAIYVARRHLKDR